MPLEPEPSDTSWSGDAPGDPRRAGGRPGAPADGAPRTAAPSAQSVAVRCGATPGYLRLKELIDRYVALAALIVAAPLLAYLIIRVRGDSPGPALFRQLRAGRHGRPFTLYKLRTMRTDVDPYGDSPNTGDDPRLTRLGRWLRETSLDELPQLLNVLRGEMSLVGPRPLYVQQIAEWNERQRGRLLVKPGLTGLAQVNGRGALTLEEKLELDVRYVESVSLRNDLGLIWRTLYSVWRKAGIYEVRYSRAQARRGQHIETDSTRR
jgi:lipopolysaccharide/colanic/teichoic acid biosynthesis glycosyltransferase